MTYKPATGSATITMYRDRLFILALFFVQGLPMGLAWLGLPPWLRQQGYSLDVIGLLGIAMLPWAIKFLWAAVVEKFCVRYGNNRILTAIQLAASVSFFVLAGLSSSNITLLMVTILLANTFCATQDIVTDRYVIQKRTLGTKSQINILRFVGFTLGMLVGGPSFLMIVESSSWEFFHYSCVALMAFIAWCSWRFVDSESVVLPKAKVSLRRFLSHLPNRWQILGVALLFKCANGLSNSMIQTLWVDRGFDLVKIGQLSTLNLILVGVVGCLLGYYLLEKKKIPSYQLILFSGICQGFVLAILGSSLALGQGVIIDSSNLLVILPAILATFDGIISLVCFSLFMGWAKGSQPGTDFTVFLSGESLGMMALSIFAGSLAGLIGYTPFFLLSAILVFCSTFYIVKIVRKSS